MPQFDASLTAESAAVSFPKDKLDILLLENVHPAAVSVLQAAGYSRIETVDKALPADQLAKRLAQAHIVGIRSKTQLTSELLHGARKLLAIGTFSIGTDQVDLPAATELGIPVFNAPFSSGRSVAELVIGAMVVLLRGLADKSAAVHRGEWPKSAAGARELRGKTLGIIGYGRIGSQVSVLAEALSMEVIYHDIQPRLALGRARAAASLQDLLERADIVTLHCPDDSSTRNLIHPGTLAYLRQGAFLINYARGKVVDIDAVASALQSGQLAGAAFDVFPEEPRGTADRFQSPLQGLPNVLLSPHIGGSTEEAQEAIGRDVAGKLVGFLDAGVTLGSVTVPELQLPAQAGARRLLHVHHNRPGVLSELNTALAERGINILGQYLKTNEQIGFVVLDIAADIAATQAAAEALRGVKHTIRVRSLY